MFDTSGFIEILKSAGIDTRTLMIREYRSANKTAQAIADALFYRELPTYVSMVSVATLKDDPISVAEITKVKEVLIDSFPPPRWVCTDHTKGLLSFERTFISQPCDGSEPH